MKETRPCGELYSVWGGAGLFCYCNDCIQGTWTYDWGAHCVTYKKLAKTCRARTASNKVRLAETTQNKQGSEGLTLPTKTDPSRNFLFARNKCMLYGKEEEQKEEEKQNKNKQQQQKRRGGGKKEKKQKVSKSHVYFIIT